MRRRRRTNTNLRLAALGLLLISACNPETRDFGNGGGGAGGEASGGGAGGAGAGATCSNESDADFCARLGKNCGQVSSPDRCGAPRTVDSCGTCDGAGQRCGAGSPGVPNVCGVAPGAILWARSTSAMAPLGLSESSTGVVVTGYFSAPIDLGGATIVPTGGADTALAEFTIKDATHVYSTMFGGAGDEFGFLNTLDPNSAPIVHGVSYGEVQDLGRGPVAGGGGTSADGFVGRYGPTGPAWVRRLVGPAEDKLVATANGPNGTLYAAGWFEGTTTLDQMPNGPRTLTSAGGRDLLITQFNTFTGAPVMVKTFGGPDREEISGIAWTGRNLVVAGFFNGTTTFGSELSMTALRLDVLVAALMPDGTPRWAARYGGPEDDRGGGVAVDAAGDIYLSGSFMERISFGTLELTAAGGSDGFVAKLDGETGGVIWANSFGSLGDDNCTGIAVDSPDQVFVVGNAAGPIEPGGLFAGGLDAVVLAYGKDGTRRWTKVIGTGGDDRAFAVATGSDTVYAGVALGGDIGASLMGVPIVGAPRPAGLIVKIQP